MQPNHAEEIEQWTSDGYYGVDNHDQTNSSPPDLHEYFDDSYSAYSYSDVALPSDIDDEGENSVSEATAAAMAVAAADENTNTNTNSNTEE